MLDVRCSMFISFFNRSDRTLAFRGGARVEQQQIIFIERSVQFSAVTQQSVQLSPELLTVIFYAGVNQLVQNGVID